MALPYLVLTGFFGGGWESAESGTKIQGIVENLEWSRTFPPGNKTNICHVRGGGRQLGLLLVQNRDKKVLGVIFSLPRDTVGGGADP